MFYQSQVVVTEEKKSILINKENEIETLDNKNKHTLNFFNYVRTRKKMMLAFTAIQSILFIGSFFVFV